MIRHSLAILFFSMPPLLAASLATAGEPSLRRVLDLDARDEPLASVVDRIRTLSGANVVLGTDKDGKGLSQNKDLRVTIHLEGAFWEVALRLACEKAGAKVEVIEGSIWRVYEPREVNLELGPEDLDSLRAVFKRLGLDPRLALRLVPPPTYVLTLSEADLGVAAMLVAELGELDVAFDASVVRGRKVTLRLHDLPWDKALDVVVRAAGLVLVAEGEGGKRRVVESDAKGETARRSPARDACAADPALRVTAVLFRPRGGKSLAVIDGEKFLEGEEKPLAADASGKTARVRLEKVREDGSAIISVDGERRVVNPGTGFGSGR